MTKGLKVRGGYECVYVGNKKKADAKASEYIGHGYIVDVLPRVNTYTDTFSDEYGVYIRKAKLKDVMKKTAK